MAEKQCPECGTRFEGTGNEKYCCEECRVNGLREANRRYGLEKRLKRKRKENLRQCESLVFEQRMKKEYLKNRNKIANINNLAREKGMSYGQYVARYGK